MKAIKFLAMAVASTAMLSSCGNAIPSVPESAKKDVSVYGITAAQVDSVSYAFGVSYGEMMKMYDMTELNLEAFVKGMTDNLAGRETGYPTPNEINADIQKYMMDKNKAVAEYNKVKGEEYLEANKAKEGVQVTESGLQYKVIAAGSEEMATAKDTVLVNYKGTLIDGTVFDSNEKEGEPVRIPLSRVIKGWSEGLQLVGKGGKMMLYIPSDLGYGAMARQPIGPNATLIFDIEIVDIFKYVEKAPEAPAFKTVAAKSNVKLPVAQSK